MLKPDHHTGSSTATISEASPTIVRQRSSRQNNWIQCALQSVRGFLHVLSSDGRIRYVSGSCKTVVGYERTQLLGCFINDFIHPDDLDVFAEEFNDALLFGNPVRFIYRFRNLSSDWVILESQCNVYRDAKPNSMSHHCELIMMARPYLSKSGALFDSFLEQRIVYERLTQQMAQLKDEEWEEDMHDDTPKKQVVDGVCVAYIQSRQSEPGQTEPRVQIEAACLTPILLRPKDASAGSHKRDKSSAQVGDVDFPVIGDAGIPISRNMKSQRTASRRKNKKRKMMSHIYAYLWHS